LCTHRRDSSKKLTDVEVTSGKDLENIWKWNATQYQPVNASPHELISETVVRQPTAPAICAWDGELSYGQLEDITTSLAFHLLDLGVNSATTVPLVFEKSMWTAVAELATMKTGAAAVAMDSTQPEARLTSIVSQIDCKIILSSWQNRDMAHRLAKGAPVVILDKANSEKWLPDHTRKLPSVDPSSQLCLIFTS
jgi:non-ribosomal peptide synthetase component F